MKRLILYFTTLTLLLSCKGHEPVPTGSLSILSGITNNSLTLDGHQGATATFSISSKFDWQVLGTPGITYSPDSGIATDKVTITATTTEANNTLSTRCLGDVIIRLDHTRFTGIVAHQRPQIVFTDNISSSINLSAEQGNTSELEFECAAKEFEVIAHGDITISKPILRSENKYYVNISATKDNLTNQLHSAGHISFTVNGVAQQGSIEAVQLPAISFAGSRITVNGVANATSTVEVITPFDFTVRSSSTAISATRSGENSILLTVNEQNDSSTERLIATLTVTLVDNPACSCSIDVWQRTAYADKALLFFMLGTSLGSYYDNNISMIESFVANNDVGNCRLLVFKQSSKNAGSLFEIFYDKSTKHITRQSINNYDLPSLYNGEMVAPILADMVRTAPALEYGLFVGSHGKGWIPKAQSSTYSLAAMELEQRIWTPAPGAAMVRHLGDNAATQINIEEFAWAIENSGAKLDYIIFDVCYMANIESIYTLRHSTEYILASPCEVMAAGMPYTVLLPAMTAQQSLKERLDNSSKLYVDYYKSTQQGIYSSACSVVVDCKQIDALAQATKRVNEALKDIDPDKIQAYDGVSSYRNPTHIFFDIEHYAELSCTDSGALETFKEQLSKTISGQHHTDTFYSAYNNTANPINYYSGLTTSAPIMLDPTSAYREQWQATEWYQATH